MRADETLANRVRPVATVPQTESIAGTVTCMVRQTSRGALPGIAAIVSDTTGALVGVFSDGDLRRAIAAGLSLETPITRVMNASPISISEEQPLQAQLQSLTQQLRHRSQSSTHGAHRISHVVVIDRSSRPRGAVDLSEFASAVETLEGSVAIVGMGYVGLTLAVALSSVGFRVIGVERDARTLRDLRDGRLHIREDGIDQVFENERRAGRLTFESELPSIVDVVIVAVGTPIDPNTGGADYSALLATADAIAPRLRYGSLVILRSTVSLGTTRGVFIPRLQERSDLRPGSEYHIAFAPERTIEGAALQELRELPQIVGGLTENCVERAQRLFALLSERTIPVESLEAAEAVKLANNTFRDLSFAFANELALICSDYNINAFKLITAANDGYPRNRIPMPSPGVGGYCLTKDPYLFSLSRGGDYYTPLLGTTGRKVNEKAVQLPIAQLEEFATALGKRPSEVRVLLAGMAFKGTPENSDLRGSTAVQVFRQLQAHGYNVRCWDMAVTREQLIEAELAPWSRCSLQDSGLDAVLILNNHVGHRSLGWIRDTKQIQRPFLFFDAFHQFHEDEIASESVVYATLGYRSRVAGKESSE